MRFMRNQAILRSALPIFYHAYIKFDKRLVRKIHKKHKNNKNVVIRYNFFYTLNMEKFDITIIGAGAAGLSAGIYSARSGMKTIILDNIGGGGQTLEIDKLENYPGFFPAANGSELIQKMSEQAGFFGAKIAQSSVESIDKKGKFFYIKTDSGEYESSAVIYATGAEHSKLGVPGEQKLTGSGVSYCAVCDGPFFKNKEVTIIGGGDSACSEALYLANIAAHVNIIHRRNEFRAAKTLSDRISANPKITVHFESIAKEILGENKVSGVLLENVKTNETRELKTDAVFICVGMKPRTALLETLQKDSGGYLITNEKMETAIPGLFAAGDVRSKPLRQIITAASDGAIAAVSAAEFVKTTKS